MDKKPPSPGQPVKKPKDTKPVEPPRPAKNTEYECKAKVIEIITHCIMVCLIIFGSVFLINEVLNKAFALFHQTTVVA